MAKNICIVAAKTVKDTGRVSFRFLSVLTPEDRRLFPFYGTLRREEKKADEINPWKFVHHKESAVGPDGFQRWHLYLFTSQGQCFSGSTDEEKNEEKGLQALLEDDAVNDCVLLVEKRIGSILKNISHHSSLSLKIYEHNGELSTS